MEILSLGEKIKRKRKKMGMTLKELAGERITPGQISLVESGKSNPSMDLLEYLATSLDTTVEYLMESEETQAEKICRYYEDRAQFYLYNKDLSIAEENIEQGLYYSEKYKLEFCMAKNMYIRACIHFSKQEWSMAQQLFLTSNVIFIKNSRFDYVIDSFVKLGRISIELNAYQSAYSYYEQALKVFLDNDEGNDFVLGEIYYSLALTNYKLDNTDKAMNYSYLAREKFNQIDNKKEYAKSLLLISEQYSKKGDIDKAIKYSKRALESFKSVNEDTYLGNIENSLGKLFYQFDNIEESFKHLEKAKEIRSKNNDQRVIETLIDICENYINIKDIENCKKTISEIEKHLNPGDKEQVTYYLLKHTICSLENDLEEAQKNLLIAFDFAQGIEDYKKSGDIAVMIGRYYMQNGKDSEAAKYLDIGVEMFKKAGILK